MRWYDILAWVLQAAGAGSAIWGLYSAETSRVVGTGSDRRLTGRGRAALAAVLAGLSAFGLNQWKDLQRGAHAESQRQAADARADSAASTLLRVRAEQEKQSASQLRQIAFLRHLSLVQQDLLGLELSWQTSALTQRRDQAAVHAATRELSASERRPPSGMDVYFESCLLSSDFVLTRRPDYSWRVDCKVARPQGVLDLTFELTLGDWKTSIIDRLLDALLTPHFALRTSEGDEVVVFSAAARPTVIERRLGRYVFRVSPTSARFSALGATDLILRMDETDRSLLPRRVRFKSLDPLAAFDQELQLVWEIRAAEVFRTFVDVGDTEPTEVTRRAAFSKPIRLRVNFDRLLNVDSSATR